jgi:uncharacterized protein DUF6152
MIDPGGNMKLKTLCVLIACSASLAVPALAHHSHGNYDTTTWTPFEGTVKELHYVTPHSFIYLEVKDEKGQPGIWLLEATNPRGLETKGIKREDVKPGDTVKVRCHRLRDGSNGCLLGFVTPLHGDAARGHGIEKEWD